ncbi:hypothetical protein HY495_03400 [Candidatus Woesearchaeota archaeon]|nr:hypothetical protein [Candidatus Woesearchaeota archaeon]
MANEQTEVSGCLQNLEMVFALPDHRIRHPNRNLVITNFRPDYFSPDEYDKLVARVEKVETGLGIYCKKYDFLILSKNVGEVIFGVDGNIIPSRIARVVIYEKELS